MKQLQIGFSPPGTSAPEISSDLSLYLERSPKFTGKLALSGLFTFQTEQGPFWDYFKGRIVFPFWKNGQVVNMIARATHITAADPYECHADKDGTVKTDDAGQPMYVKYKKLRRHDPSDDKRKHISRFIGMETFMGSDAIRGAKQIIITEGAPDWVSAVDHGFAALSPVTTNFRDEDLEKLAQSVAIAETVYIINDNEENQAGMAGAMKTASYLARRGHNVYLVELPRPQGVDKVDLNEYLKAHSAADLKGLMSQTKSIIDIQIANLPADFVKAQPQLREQVLPMLLQREDSVRKHYIDMIKKIVKTSKASVDAELAAVIEASKSETQQSEEATVDPQIQSMSQAIANDPVLIRNRIDAVNKSGVVGERNVIAMYFATLDSRLLPEDTASPNALAIKNAGHHGSGKSFAMKKCLELYPPEAYHMITSGSAKSLYYLPEGLKHRALIVAEAFQFQATNAADSEFVYVVRSLLSEGRVSYQVPQKDDDGKFVTVEKRLDGPTSFITTTIIDKLEPQLEDRLFTIHPDESKGQTRAIMSMTARIKDGSFEGIDQKLQSAWQHFHAQLKPALTIIPYATKISDHLQRDPQLPIATRRAFNRVMAIIQTVTCAYQHQRSKDNKGQLIAEISDYWMALQIVREAFRETLGQQSKETQHRIAIIRDKGPVQYKALATEWGISKAALSGWATGKIKDNLLVWCDENGGLFDEDGALKRAKHSGSAYLKVNDDSEPKDPTGLPTPFELTGNPRWHDGGDLLNQYDLGLESRQEANVDPSDDEDIENQDWMPKKPLSKGLFDQAIIIV